MYCYRDCDVWCSYDAEKGAFSVCTEQEAEGMERVMDVDFEYAAGETRRGVVFFFPEDGVWRLRAHDYLGGILVAWKDIVFRARSANVEGIDVTFDGTCFNMHRQNNPEMYLNVPVNFDEGYAVWRSVPCKAALSDADLAQALVVLQLDFFLNVGDLCVDENGLICFNAYMKEDGGEFFADRWHSAARQVLL